MSDSLARPASTSRRPACARIPGVERERAFWDAGMGLVAGVDEVGRGAIAGPLVAAAVILPACAGAKLGALRRRLAGTRDSKTVTPLARERLLEPIRTAAVAVGVGIVEHDEFDALGMSAANRLAMERAVLALPPALDLGLPQVGAIDADAHCLSVAAASIVAKVTRDAMMVAHDADDPRYGFAGHKGYGTELHFARLLTHGPGPIHRLSIPRVANGGLRP